MPHLKTHFNDRARREARRKREEDFLFLWLLVLLWLQAQDRCGEVSRPVPPPPPWRLG